MTNRQASEVFIPDFNTDIFSRYQRTFLQPKVFPNMPFKQEGGYDRSPSERSKNSLAEG